MDEAVLLSTCNRTELYLHATGNDDLAGVRALLASRAGPMARPLDEYLYERSGEAAARHLFRVASGLDAMVIGEAEIQGQVREAYERSATGPDGVALAGPVLHRLFQMALSAGGRVRSETKLGEGSASVAYVAVELTRKIFGSLSGRQVLVLGAGDNSELVVDALAREGVSGAVVANRTYERAQSLAQRLAGRAVRMGELAQALAGCDVVVASTAAPHPVLTADTLREAMPDGVRRPLLMIDLAVPRDIDPAVGAESNVFLYNVDDLRQIVDANLAQRKRAVPEAERIVEDMTTLFRGWYAAQEAVPFIRSLRDRGEAVRMAEMDRLLARLPDLRPDQRAHLEDFSRRFLNKLLHAPTARLRQGARDPLGGDLLEAARFLYGLDAESDPPGDTPDPNGETTEDHDDE